MTQVQVRNLRRFMQFLQAAIKSGLGQKDGTVYLDGDNSLLVTVRGLTFRVIVMHGPPES